MRIAASLAASHPVSLRDAMVISGPPSTVFEVWHERFPVFGLPAGTWLSPALSITWVKAETLLVQRVVMPGQRC